MTARDPDTNAIFDLSTVTGVRNKPSGQSINYQEGVAGQSQARIGLIDSYALTRNCLIEASAASERRLSFCGFVSIDEFMNSDLGHL